MTKELNGFISNNDKEGSSMKHIIETIQYKLIYKVPELKYVDQDWGQMDFYSQPPVEFPCALIDIQSVQYTNNGKFIQQGTATIVILLFDSKISDGSEVASVNQTEDAKKIWQLIEDVNKAIHGQAFLQEGYGFPMRTQMQRTKRNESFYQTELYYTVQFTDTTCEPEMTPVLSVKPELEIANFKKS